MTTKMKTVRNENLNTTKKLNETDIFCSVDEISLRQTSSHWAKENNTINTSFFTHF